MRFTQCARIGLDIRRVSLRDIVVSTKTQNIFSTVSILLRVLLTTHADLATIRRISSAAGLRFYVLTTMYIIRITYYILYTSVPFI